MKKIRIGILSTAKIGLTKVIPAMQRSMHCDVTAICSRNEKSAHIAAKALNIPKAYGSYEQLLANPNIDAVYIPLPNHLHVQWAMTALEAGKHVLCEKPIGLNTAEARTLMDTAAKHPDLKIMEAFMYRHHPQWIEAGKLVTTGAIGELVTIQSFFSYYNANPENIRNKADIGGGGLMDIGCYNISLSRFLFRREPDRVAGFMDLDPTFGTDRLFSGMMNFAGKVSTFTCSTQLAEYQRVNILGTTGRIEILIPFNAPPDKPCTIILQDDSTDTVENISFDACDQYTIQADRFAMAVINNTDVPTPLSDALNNMHVLETLVKSAKTGQWVAC
ncbi:MULTISPECIES: Gfo/Idh/MocA family oxidoreductase [unclassified Pseudodesulfovibrio]|uniref:Gfo/Idh/MocA family protein n=1 Tax=unclassified Pseudodesulfovibrio TaxID=2661612 RepID=UPI000FEB6AEC|nr:MULTISPECIES: Gfo/Idh/MocA family oxidoreductase [unclassified Pseudodesulfovibrio]MCJ2164405.1 Gfo/Idh/MocA family oxidoreductase [Pseudodesulfovibrio sp. S3-i]RWU04611.1 gfo/Idh/MocA family oxidoreductase [Pseudodesulfovibrio sp. S3]